MSVSSHLSGNPSTPCSTETLDCASGSGTHRMLRQVQVCSTPTWHRYTTSHGQLTFRCSTHWCYMLQRKHVGFSVIHRTPKFNTDHLPFRLGRVRSWWAFLIFWGSLILNSMPIRFKAWSFGKTTMKLKQREWYLQYMSYWHTYPGVFNLVTVVKVFLCQLHILVEQALKMLLHAFGNSESWLGPLPLACYDGLDWIFRSQ